MHTLFGITLRCFSVGLFINQFFLSLFWSLTLCRQQWQIEKGFCPLIIGVGEPGMGKTKAGNVALATAGSYPKRFYNLFTDAHNGSVSSFTTMGFQADDPTDPSEIGKAAKRFFSDGTSANCRKELLSKTSPICTVNPHVVRWLLHPDRQRYVCFSIVIYCYYFMNYMYTGV